MYTLSMLRLKGEYCLFKDDLLPKITQFIPSSRLLLCCNIITVLRVRHICYRETSEFKVKGMNLETGVVVAPTAVYIMM